MIVVGRVGAGCIGISERAYAVAADRAAGAGDRVLGDALGRIILEVVITVGRGVGVGDAVDVRAQGSREPSVGLRPKDVFQPVYIAARFAGVITQVGGIERIAAAVLYLRQFQVADVAVGLARKIGVQSLANGRPGRAAVGAAPQED